MNESIKHLEAARLHFGDHAIRNVLLPTDFTDKSLRPLGLAAELAASANAELHLLHVHGLTTPVPQAWEFPPANEVRRSTWASSPDTLRAWAMDALPNLVVHTATRQDNNVSKTILDYAQENSVDLIVVGTAARRGLARVFLGSVAERLVLSARCPVLTMAQDAPVAIAPKSPNVLVPVDFSKASIESLARAASLAEQLKGQLTLLHVISPQPVPVLYGEVAPMLWDTQEGASRLGKHLEELARSVRETVPVKCIVRVGQPARCIAQVASEVGADLVQIGSHGLTGFSRYVIGSVAQKVLRLAAVPVLIFKPDDEQASEAAGELMTASQSSSEAVKQ